MRKVIFFLLLGLSGFYSVGVQASSPSAFPVQIACSEAEISPALAERIIRQVELEHGLDYECLCGKYRCGELTIDKVAEGYLVTVEDGGGLIQILIADDF